MSSAGESIDDGKGRIFPCEGCGADLEFSIHQQRMKCPYCGFEKDLEIDPNHELQEQDLEAILKRLAELHENKQATSEPKADSESENEVQCSSCGGTVLFTGPLISTECPYCASPIQREDIHAAADRISIDGVLPFLIPKQTAQREFKAWVASRWFAPNAFLRWGVTGKFHGVYLPYWTFDSMTHSRYVGERGEYYKDRQGKTRTRWYSASGDFKRFSDDVLVPASTGLPRDLLHHLEPWRLNKCMPFTPEALAGHTARAYETELAEGFSLAKQRMDEYIKRDVAKRIGGDKQRIHALDTRYDALTFKHILLPIWMLAFRFNNSTYQVFINASTGEVSGRRPYSTVKIALAVIGAILLIGIISMLDQRFGR